MARDTPRQKPAPSQDRLPPRTSPKLWKRFQRGLAKRRPSRVHRLSVDELNRVAYDVLPRFYAMPADGLVITGLLKRNRISPGLRSAARSLGLRDCIRPADIGEPLRPADLWKMREDTFGAGNWILFRFTESAAEAPVLIGKVRKLDGARVELELSGRPRWRKRYANALLQDGVTIESTEIGRVIEQNWKLGSVLGGDRETLREIIPAEGAHGGRLAFRRPDWWASFVRPSGSASGVPRARRLEEVKRDREMIRAMMGELARLRGKARQKARQREGARARQIEKREIRELRDAYRNLERDSEVDLDPSVRRKYDMKVAAIRRDHPRPRLADEVAKALLEWGLYDRKQQENLGNARAVGRGRQPRWPGLRATLHRLSADHSIREVHVAILKLHRRLTR